MGILLPPDQKITCEGIQLMFDQMGRDFSDAGCSWGKEPNAVFEARYYNCILQMGKKYLVFLLHWTFFPARRFLKLVQSAIQNDCGFTTIDGTPVGGENGTRTYFFFKNISFQIGEVNTDLPSILCSAEKEVYSAWEQVARCGFRVQQDHHQPNASACEYLPMYSQCFEGLVDR